MMTPNQNPYQAMPSAADLARADERAKAHTQRLDDHSRRINQNHKDITKHEIECAKRYGDLQNDIASSKAELVKHIDIKIKQIMDDDIRKDFKVVVIFTCLAFGALGNGIYALINIVNLLK